MHNLLLKGGFTVDIFSFIFLLGAHLLGVYCCTRLSNVDENMMLNSSAYYFICYMKSHSCVFFHESTLFVILPRLANKN